MNGPNLAPFLDAARAALGRQITYHRGAASRSLTATRGRRPSITTDADGQPLAVELPSWILRRSDLTLNGAAITPQEGDTITTTTTAGTESYRVTPDPLSGRAWETSDPDACYLRIYTTRTA